MSPDGRTKALPVEGISKIAAGQSHLLLLDRKGRLFACGINDNAQLGLPTDRGKLIITPRDITDLILVSFRPHGDKQSLRITNIFAAGNCSWCEISDKARKFIVGWGCNSHGQLGVGKIDIEKEESQRLAFRERPICLKTFTNLQISSICGGIDFTLFLTRCGKVFACGRGDFGQLGHLQPLQHRYKSKDGSKRAFLCPRPIQLKHGTLQSKYMDLDLKKVAVCEQAVLPALGGSTHKYMPSKPDGLFDMPPIAQISANSRSACAISKCGKLFVWGDNYCGQLALGDLTENIPFGMLPIQIEFKHKHVQCLEASMGWGHLLVRANL